MTRSVWWMAIWIGHAIHVAYNIRNDVFTCIIMNVLHKIDECVNHEQRFTSKFFFPVWYPSNTPASIEIVYYVWFPSWFFAAPLSQNKLCITTECTTWTNTNGKSHRNKVAAPPSHFEAQLTFNYGCWYSSQWLSSIHCERAKACNSTEIVETYGWH